MFFAALAALGAGALRSAPGADAAAHELADAVMERLHPHHKEIDAEIEQGLNEMAVNEPASWRGKDVIQMTQEHAQEKKAQAPVSTDTAAAAKEIAAAVEERMRPAKEAQESIEKGLDEIAVNEPSSWRISPSSSILSQIPDEPDAAKKVYYTLSGEPLPGSMNSTATPGATGTPNTSSKQGPWGEQIGCPHCGDVTGNCDCADHDHEKAASESAAQPPAAFLKAKEATSKHPPK